MSIENEIINNTPQFVYLVPFFKSALESGLAYDFIKGMWNEIPIANRMTPAKNIAVPCLEGIVLNTDNEILQNSFIAILEKAMDNRETDSQHPSFSLILNQLFNEEIILLYSILSGKCIVCCQSEKGYIYLDDKILKNHFPDFENSGFRLVYQYTYVNFDFLENNKRRLTLTPSGKKNYKSLLE